MIKPKSKTVSKAKKSKTVVEDFNLTRHTGDLKPAVSDLLKRLHIDASMSMTQIVMAARDYLSKQPNPIRACNAILFKLGVDKQFKDEPRKARVYTFTAIEEAIKQGDRFDPLTIPTIAENRNIKISNIMGPDFESVEDNSNTINNVKIKSKKELVTEIYMANNEKPTAELVKLIVDRIQIQKASAYSILYAVRKSLIV